MVAIAPAAERMNRKRRAGWLRFTHAGLRQRFDLATIVALTISDPRSVRDEAVRLLASTLHYLSRPGIARGAAIVTENAFRRERPRQNMTTDRNRVVVVGGGFAGVRAVKTLARVDVDVTLIDCTNYHLFQPLSYQVATGSLSPGEIAVPLRQIFRREPRVRVVMGEVTAFDLNRREVIVSSTAAGIAPGSIPYDALVVAAGSSYSYCGRERWRSVALEVKSLDTSPHPSHSLSNGGLEGLSSKVRLISHPAYGFHSANALNRDDLPLLRWHPNRASHR